MITKLMIQQKLQPTFDDVTAADRIIKLKNWWKTLCILGPKFGYYPEASKS